MTVQLEGRVLALEDAYELETLVNLHIRQFDALANGANDTFDISLYSREFQWNCNSFCFCNGLDAYISFLQAYSRRVSFSLQLLVPLGAKIDDTRSLASGKWGVWQPFTFQSEPWLLAGYYENTFTRENSWKLAKAELTVEILTPWSEGWGDERVSRNWSW